MLCTFQKANHSKPNDYFMDVIIYYRKRHLPESKINMVKSVSYDLQGLFYPTYFLLPKRDHSVRGLIKCSNFFAAANSQ